MSILNENKTRAQGNTQQHNAYARRPKQEINYITYKYGKKEKRKKKKS